MRKSNLEYLTLRVEKLESLWDEMYGISGKSCGNSDCTNVATPGYSSCGGCREKDKVRHKKSRKVGKLSKVVEEEKVRKRLVRLYE